jgi:hypothetical protein
VPLPSKYREKKPWAKIFAIKLGEHRVPNPGRAHRRTHTHPAGAGLPLLCTLSCALSSRPQPTVSCRLCLCLAAMLARLFRGNTVVPRSHGCLLSQPELHMSVATVDEHVVWAPVRDLAGAALALESDAPPHGWTGTPSPAGAVALLASAVPVRALGAVGRSGPVPSPAA